MANFKKALIFIFFVAAGITVGSLVAYLCKGVSFLSWLSFASDLGVDPINLDLSIIKLTFGIKLSVSISHIIFLITSMVIYGITRKNIE